MIKIKESGEESKVIKNIEYYLNHHLSKNDEYCTIDSISKTGDNEYTADCKTRVSIPLGYDSETGSMEYEYDEVYSSYNITIDNGGNVKSIDRLY